MARVKWASSKESHVIAVKSAELVLCPEFSAEFEQLNSTSCPPFSFLDCSVHLKIKLHLDISENDGTCILKIAGS